MKEFEKLKTCDAFNCSSYYRRNYTGLEDNESFTNFSKMSNWVWGKLQEGCFIEVNGETPDGEGVFVRFNPELVEYGEEAYDIDDYLEESVNEDNAKKINESVDSYDIDDLLTATLSFIFDFCGLDYDDAFIYASEGEFEPDEFDDQSDYPDLEHPITDDYYARQWFSDSVREQLENKDPELLDQIVDYIDFYNDEGRGYDNDIDVVVTYLEEGLKNNNNKKINEEYSGIDLNQYRDTIIGALALAKEYSKVQGPIMTAINHLYNLLDKDEYAKRINKNVDDWTEDDYEGAYEHEADKRDEEFSDMYESVNNKKSNEDNYEADDEFVDGEEKTEDKMTESLNGFKKLAVKSFVSEFNNSGSSVQANTNVDDEIADESFAHDDSM